MTKRTRIDLEELCGATRTLYLAVGRCKSDADMRGNYLVESFYPAGSGRFPALVEVRRVRYGQRSGLIRLTPYLLINPREVESSILGEDHGSFYGVLELSSVFVDYNNAFRFVPVATYALGLAALVLIVRGESGRHRFISGVLAAFWIWNGAAYHLGFFRAITPPRPLPSERCFSSRECCFCTLESCAIGSRSIAHREPEDGLV